MDEYSPPPPRMSQRDRQGDEAISLHDLWQKCLRAFEAVWADRRVVAWMLALSVAAGFVLAFGSQVEYTASTKILPYRSGGSPAGLSGLAGLAGVRLPSATTDQTITADLYPEVARTLDFRVDVAETPIRFSSLTDAVTPMKYFSEIAKPSMVESLGRYTVGLPRLLLTKMRRPATESRGISVGVEGPPIAEYDTEYRRVLGVIGERLSVTADKRTMVITMAARMPDRFAAADLVRTASDLLMARIIEYEARKAAEQLRYLEEQTTAARDRLDRVLREQAVLSDRSRGTVSATAQLETQRLQRDYALAFDVYRQFAGELEQARIKKSQDTPVFTVLEQVVVPDTRSSPKRGRILVVSMLTGLLAGVALVGVRRVARV